MPKGNFVLYTSPITPKSPRVLLQCVSHVTVKQLTVDMSLLLQNFSFSVCATKNPNYYLNVNIKFEYLVV